MKEIYLIRHTTPDIKPGICYGASDVDVNGDFDVEAESIRKILSDFKPEHLFSSPLKRCAKLADYLFPYNQKRLDIRLKEMDFGQWELGAWQDIDKEEMDIWSSDFVNSVPSTGESFQEVFNRMVSFFEEQIHLLPDQSNAAIVTHSGIIRCVLAHHLSIPLNKIFRLKINFGAVVKLVMHKEYSEIEFLKP